MKRFCSGGEKTRIPPAEQSLRIASEPPLPSPPPHPEARITFGRNPRAPVADPHVAHLWNPARRRVSRSRLISWPPITSAVVPAAAAASSRPLLCRRRPISFAFCRVRLAALRVTQAALEDSWQLFVLQTLRPVASPPLPRRPVPRLPLLWREALSLPPPTPSHPCLPAQRRRVGSSPTPAPSP